MLTISTNQDKYSKNNPSFLYSVILQTEIAIFLTRYLETPV